VIDLGSTGDDRDLPGGKRRVQKLRHIHVRGTKRRRRVSTVKLYPCPRLLDPIWLVWTRHHCIFVICNLSGVCVPHLLAKVCLLACWPLTPGTLMTPWQAETSTPKGIHYKAIVPLFVPPFRSLKPICSRQRVDVFHDPYGAAGIYTTLSSVRVQFVLVP
jgi:hypothetical protein